VFWIIFYFFALAIFSYILYNSKWSKNFQACSQLALKNKSKEAPPFWIIFHTNVSLWSVAARFFTGPKKGFVTSNANILQSTRGNFWIFSKSYQFSVLPSPTVTYVQKCYFFLKFGTCIRNGSFWTFVAMTESKNFRG